MLYDIYKGRFERTQTVYSWDDKFIFRVNRDALTLNVRVRTKRLSKLTRLGWVYQITIKSNFMAFKYKAWKFNRKIEKILKLRNEGYTLREIAKIVGCTHQNVDYFIKKLSK